MARKKKEEEEIVDPYESLRAFVIESKVSAFAYQYEPCSSEDEADEAFTDEKLRKYFNAYPRPTGDPLVIYVDELLANLGFRMSHSFLLNEPVILVRIKT